MPNPADVQGLVANSYPHPERAVLLFQISDPTAARRFVGQWLEHAPGGLADIDPLQPVLHFAFSWSGLRKLLDRADGLDVAEGRRQMDVFFTNPTQSPDSPALAGQLGFVGDSAPENWWSNAFETPAVELVVFGYFGSVADKLDWMTSIRRSAAEAEMVELQLPEFEHDALSGAVPEDGVLHFGYRDGISKHVIDWTDSGADGTVDFREFIVGYPNANYPTSPFKSGPWQDFARNGSYVGLTWLYQDVARFNRFLTENAASIESVADTDDGEEWLAAKLMGRWRNGSPLAEHPDTQPATADLSNEFNYSDDKDGLKCPLMSHIRVANLRDQPLSFANELRFPNGAPKLIRNGFSYGTPLAGHVDDGEDRGLVGVFACARLNEQFYTVLRWMQKTDFSDDFASVPNGLSAQDNLFGNRGKAGAETTANLPVSNTKSIELDLPDFIRFKGVAVLFSPSLTALATIAG